MSEASSSRFRAIVCSTSDTAFKDCLDIRMKVFVEEQRFTVEEEIDGLDEHTTHLLLLDNDNTPVGTLRYFEPPKRVFGRLAVLSPYRKTGAARAMLFALDDYMRQTDSESSLRITAHAQVRSIRFYEKTGWHREGEDFIEDGQPHCNVWRDVPLERDLSTPPTEIRLHPKGRGG